MYNITSRCDYGRTYCDVRDGGASGEYFCVCADGYNGTSELRLADATGPTPAPSHVPSSSPTYCYEVPVVCGKGCVEYYTECVENSNSPTLSFTETPTAGSFTRCGTMTMREGSGWTLTRPNQPGGWYPDGYATYEYPSGIVTSDYASGSSVVELCLPEYECDCYSTDW